MLWCVCVCACVFVYSDRVRSLDDSYDDLKELFVKCTAFNPQQRPDMLAVKEELVKFM